MQDNIARDIFDGLVNKAHRLFVPGKGVMLCFPEMDFYNMVEMAARRIIIHLPSPRESMIPVTKEPRKPKQPVVAQPEDELVGGLVRLGFGRRESLDALATAVGNTDEERMSDAIKKLGVG